MGFCTSEVSQDLRYGLEADMSGYSIELTVSAQSGKLSLQYPLNQISKSPLGHYLVFT
jgi:hypothetical protein